jgi:dolichyl-phosphate-mannose-protein mannosyltransferase
MHSEKLRVNHVLLLAGLIILAAILRFWHLGEWNFQATEIFTLRDSATPQFLNPRPLGYLLNYYLVRPFLPLDEFGLRLVPAIFGVLIIPVFYLVSRRLLGTGAALFATLLLTVSPLHIMYSQLARYWSLVFFFSAIYPFALYQGIREHNGRKLGLGVLTGLLSILSHPMAGLLLIGLAIWFSAIYLRPARLIEWWRQPKVRWVVGIGLIVVAILAVRFVGLLKGWISEQDSNPGGGQFLVRHFPPGARQLFYLLNFAEGVTIGVVLSAIAGVYLIWRERDRSLGVLLASLAVVPIAFLTLLTLRTSVSTYYLLPTVPVFFMGAGVFLDWLSTNECGMRPRWLLPATVVAIIIAAGMPTLISDLRDGRRYNFRQAAQWLEHHATPGDVVFSDQHMVTAHYLPQIPVERLRDTLPLAEAVSVTHRSGARNAVWIVAPVPSHAFRTNLKAGGLSRWIYEHCRLETMLGVGRVDARQQYLQLYRCSSVPDVSESPARN